MFRNLLSFCENILRLFLLHFSAINLKTIEFFRTYFSANYKRQTMQRDFTEIWSETNRSRSLRDADIISQGQFIIIHSRRRDEHIQKSTRRNNARLSRNFIHLSLYRCLLLILGGLDRALAKRRVFPQLIVSIIFR